MTDEPTAPADSTAPAGPTDATAGPTDGFGGGGAGGPEPFARRYGLTRPKEGRHLAGVCAAIGRATGTDPLLWRVLLAVLICFAGIGALIYLLVWLLTPEEGDTASPLEALMRDGQSSTSPVLAVVIGVATIALLALVLQRPMYLVLLTGVVVLAILLWDRQRASVSTAQAPPAPTQPGPAPSGPASAGPASVAATTVPGAPPVTTGPGSAAASGYRPPFAPHGPYGGPPPPPPPPARPPQPPRPPRERSPLTAITFFATLVALGVVGMVDLGAPVDIPLAGYVATALAVVGGGLLVGAWLGRARLLIPIGLLLTVLLVGVHSVATWEPPQQVATSVEWAPASVGELQESYAVAFGEGQLDLREVDFSGERVEMTVTAQGGSIIVWLPLEVAVTTDSEVMAGSVTVFGETTSGLLVSPLTTHPADSQTDHGEVVLRLRAQLGNIEVIR